MKVFVLSCEILSDFRLVGVYSSHEKAQAAVNELEGAQIGWNSTGNTKPTGKEGYYYYLITEMEVDPELRRENKG